MIKLKFVLLPESALGPDTVKFKEKLLIVESRLFDVVPVIVFEASFHTNPNLCKKLRESELKEALKLVAGKLVVNV